MTAVKLIYFNFLLVNETEKIYNIYKYKLSPHWRTFLKLLEDLGNGWLVGNGDG